jgi:hypothetical protein
MRATGGTSGPRRKRERGVALIVTLLIMVIMTLLGIPFLLMGETENRMAENERLSQQALYAADAGAKMVVRWFDRPMHAGNALNPTLAAIDRTQRLIDDGDPGTPPVAADGTAAKPYYKQGVDAGGDGDDDVFDKPYRDSPGESVHALLGTEDGPDMVIHEPDSAAAAAFLEDLSQSLLPAYPSPGVHARITRIDVYGPPYAQKGGAWTRLGVGRIKVLARLYTDLPDGSEQILAQRMVKVLINEVPYGASVLGALHSCDALEWDGDFTVHWGLVTSVSGATLDADHEKLAAGLPRPKLGTPGLPPLAPGLDLLWGFNSAADWQAYYKNILEEYGHEIEDPWLRVVTGGNLVAPAGGVAGAQPWPFEWLAGNPLADGDITFHSAAAFDPGVAADWDGTHSNVLRNTDFGCPEFPYEVWKQIAQGGGFGVHYLEWIEDDKFREKGTADALSFGDITDGRAGFFFFDTEDGEPPRDDDADGDYDNLTPAIQLNGGTWGVRGMVYLNAEGFEVEGAAGREAPFAAPAEPYRDANTNGKFDPGSPGENHLNLEYPVTLSGGQFLAKKEDIVNDVYDASGPTILEDANLWGIFYTSGHYNARGDGVYYGATIAVEGVSTTGVSTGTAHHYRDQNLGRTSVPGDWGLPRVHVTARETDL